MSIENQIINYFKEQLGVEVSDSTALIEEGVIDSMGIIEFVSFISEEFDVEVDTDDMVVSNFETIPAVISFIDSKK